MSARRLSIFFLGLWLGCAVFMAWVATNNLQSVEPLLKQQNRVLQREVNDIGYERMRTLMRFQAAELNRHYFYYWGYAQIGLMLLIGVLLLFGTNGNLFVMITMLVLFLLHLVQHFLVSAQVVEIGRGIDFALMDQFVEERRAFKTYHTYYSVIEVIKWIGGLLVAIRMLMHGSGNRRRRRSSASGNERLRRVDVDAIDDPDNGYVDR